MNEEALVSTSAPSGGSTCGNCGGPVVPVQGGGGVVCANGC